MVSHTPGPWTVAVEGGRSGIYRVQNAITDHDAANVRLIAMAPDLLNVCEIAVLTLRKRMGGERDILVILLEAAIKHATGGQ